MRGSFLRRLGSCGSLNFDRLPIHFWVAAHPIQSGGMAVVDSQPHRQDGGRLPEHFLGEGRVVIGAVAAAGILEDRLAEAGALGELDVTANAGRKNLRLRPW